MNRRKIATQLELAEQDAQAAQLLAQHGNRYAAFHCQQAAEKLIKAILDQRGIEYGGEHHLDVLVDRLADDDPWKPILRKLERHTPYATTFRYAKPSGGLMPAPDPKVSMKDAAELQELIGRARADLGMLS